MEPEHILVGADVVKQAHANRIQLWSDGFYRTPKIHPDKTTLTGRPFWQIEGGFVQGVGWLTTEQLVWNDKGQLSTHAPSTYKIPTAGDVPEHFKVALWTEANREDTVFGSKAVGEPPLMLAISVWEAFKEAIAAARAGAVRLDAPATAENILKALKA